MNQFLDEVNLMSKSRAKKKREKLEREGKRNPDQNRGIYAFADMRTRITKTKKDQLYNQKYKNQSLNDNNDGSFFIVTTLFIIIVDFYPELLSSFIHLPSTFFLCKSGTNTFYIAFK